MSGFLTYRAQDEVKKKIQKIGRLENFRVEPPIRSDVMWLRKLILSNDFNIFSSIGGK